MKRILQIAVITALTVFFLFLFLKNSNLPQVWRIMKSISLSWLIFGLLVNFTALIFRTIRWRILIDADSPPPFYPTFFANTVGYMLSSILPIRAADVARPALLARRTGVRFSGALGTVLTERLLDLYTLLLLYAYYVFAHWNDFDTDARKATAFMLMKSGAVGVSIFIAVLSGTVLAIYFYRDATRRAFEWTGRLLPERFRSSWMHFFETFVASLEIVHRPALVLKVLACTVGVWACLTGQFWIVLRGMRETLPFDTSFFITGVTTLGLAVPTPGGVGGFHAVCQILLTTFFDFDINRSVAVAIMFHVVGTVPVLITGLLLFAHAGLRLRDVQDDRET